MSAERKPLRATAEIAADYVESLGNRPIRAGATVEELRAALAGPLPESPTEPLRVVSELAAEDSPGLAAAA